MQWLYLLSLIVLVTANHEDLWHQWKRIHGKEYNGVNEATRRLQWEKTVDEIGQHNLRHDLGLETYTMGLNQFADLSWDEFRAQYLHEFVVPSDTDLEHGIPFKTSSNLPVPDSLDWREKGIISLVKNQGYCGSCWAFASTGAIEAQYKKTFGEDQLFSEQQLVDCSRGYGNFGCAGGLMENAYMYIAKSGLEAENVYPYRGWEQPCLHNQNNSLVKTVAYAYVHDNDESRLKTMLFEKGPAAVAIFVERGFRLYKSGVYTTNACPKKRVNHGVLAVGYGREGEADYWIVKNSWGPEWGDKGYIRMARNRDNMCSIATLASVPIVEKM
ncbi:unnamed protein product [Echinostoma caproni]|uniref:Pept_C1 domain-containing protein n=1 Tax=Echinostoma caproni TaxID=27848 RepID=A0A183AS06_9TREM|nr:unnamed protein product [Echinostoma caproni]